MKKKLLTLFTVCCLGMSMTVPVMANNSTDTTLPEKFVDSSRHVQTGLRSKQDKTPHYVYNTSKFGYQVISYNENFVNHTVNKTATVAAGKKRFVRNTIYKDGFRKCRLDITVAKVGTSGNVQGIWSPDSVGSYPYAN